MNTTRWCYAAAPFLFTLSLAAQQPRLGPAPQQQPRPTEKAATAPAPLPQTTRPHVLTAADLEPFLDGLMPLQLQRDDIAGAVVCVVKAGQVMFCKGYGYADYKNKKPVSPDDTLFRPGSISKLFTWTAVMQLVEQGKLNLAHDVNEYLDFRIPDRYRVPISLQSLMTHTAGFQESDKDLFVAHASDLTPIGSYLKAHLPARIFPPNSVPAYSNYGAALAGYIVQRVSGKPFEQYVEEHIFAPLGMTHATFRQPLPAALKPLMSEGYLRAFDGAKGFEWIEVAPAGSLSASASDLARFMIAHLQDGHFGAHQILRPETARMMHSRQFGLIPELNGMALGFYEENRNGQRVIGHGGDTVYFHSDMHLMLDAGIGFFVSYNSPGRGDISERSALWRAFLDRYFPNSPPPAGVNQAQRDARSVAGIYLTSRRSQTNFLKLGWLAEEFKVAANSDGTLTVPIMKDLNGKAKKWREVGPLLYRSIDSNDRMGFRKTGDRYDLVPDIGILIYQPVGALNSSGLNQAILFCSLAIFVLALVLWPWNAIVRRHYGRKLEWSREDLRWRMILRAICAVDLIFLSVSVSFLSRVQDPTVLNDRLDTAIHLMQLLGTAGALATLVAVYAVWRSWKYSQRGRWSKLGDTLITLACLGYLFFVLNWHMLNFNLNY